MSICVTEIAKVRASLFQISGVKKEPLILPEQEGDVTTLTEKVYVPVKEHPDVSIQKIQLYKTIDLGTVRNVAIYSTILLKKYNSYDYMYIIVYLSWEFFKNK